MASKEYPYETDCDNCGQTIYVYQKKDKTGTYARNSKKFIDFKAGGKMDFHQCQNWRPREEPKEKPKEEPKVNQKPPQVVQRSNGGLVPEFVPANDKYQFDRTFKLVEVTASISKKVSEKTIAEIPQFENETFFVALKAELELGANLQEILRQLFSEGVQAINMQIEDTRIRLKNLKESRK
jgi:hypothetical protein